MSTRKKKPSLYNRIMKGGNDDPFTPVQLVEHYKDDKVIDRFVEDLFFAGRGDYPDVDPRMLSLVRVLFQRLRDAEQRLASAERLLSSVNRMNRTYTQGSE